MEICQKESKRHNGESLDVFDVIAADISELNRSECAHNRENEWVRWGVLVAVSNIDLKYKCSKNISRPEEAVALGMLR